MYGSPTRQRFSRSSGGEELADNAIAEATTQSSEGTEIEATTTDNLEENETDESQIMTEDLKVIESEDEKSAVESEDLMVEEESTDEATGDAEGDKKDESSEQSTLKPREGSRYGSSSYGNRNSNIGGSSSFNRASFGGHRFSSPAFFGNFGRDRFGPGNGRTSFHHQTFGFQRN